MGGVPHVEGGLNSELYAIPVKRRQPKDQKNNAILQNNTQEKPADVDSTDSEDKDENLPPGWQKHEGRYRKYVLNSKEKNLFQDDRFSFCFINRDNFFNASGALLDHLEKLCEIYINYIEIKTREKR